MLNSAGKTTRTGPKILSICSASVRRRIGDIFRHFSVLFWAKMVFEVLVKIWGFFFSSFSARRLRFMLLLRWGAVFEGATKGGGRRKRRSSSSKHGSCKKKNKKCTQAEQQHERREAQLRKWKRKIKEQKKNATDWQLFHTVSVFWASGNVCNYRTIFSTCAIVFLFRCKFVWWCFCLFCLPFL